MRVGQETKYLMHLVETIISFPISCHRQTYLLYFLMQGAFKEWNNFLKIIHFKNQKIKKKVINEGWSPSLISFKEKKSDIFQWFEIRILLS